MKRNRNMKCSRTWMAGVVISVLVLTAGMITLIGCGPQDEKQEGGAEGMGFFGEDDGSDRDARIGMDVPEELEAVNDQIGQVSYRMFQQAMSQPAEEGTSAMVSPLSLLTCLSMAQAGAEGNTKTEMEQTFGFTSESFASWLESWYDSLTEEDETRMNVANSFWYRQGFQAEEDYLLLLEDRFHGKAREAAFDDSTVSEINQWCDENTYGMIPRLINQLDPDQQAILLNAVAFEGKWQKAYEEDLVSEGETFVTEDGTEQDAVMLYSREEVYLSGEHTTGFLKLYQDGYSFAAFLPEEGMSVEDWLKETSEEEFTRMLQESEYAQVSAVIPEFKSEYTAQNMKSVLQDMGIQSLFSAGDCDLSAMGKSEGGDSLYVSDVLHKTFIELNREGTRAAAVTGLVMKATSMEPEKVYEVRLDRPFVYAILDQGSMTPIFMGIVMNVA